MFFLKKKNEIVFKDLFSYADHVQETSGFTPKFNLMHCKKREKPFTLFSGYLGTISKVCVCFT